jgi:hypothetical protein
MASLLWLTAAVGAFGQSGSSTILGTLTDPVDAVLAGANVTVTEQATGATHTSTSNETGLFRLLNLLPGRYALRVEVAGFKALDIKDIGLASSENHDLGKLVLQLGAVTEEVAVTAQATPVQTASSERSELIDGNQLKDVALKGRDAFGFMRLVSGVIDTTSDRSLAGPGSMANLYINGMDSRMKNVTFDGVTEIDQGASSQTFVVPNMDAISEMKILTSAYQAEYGRTAGGGVNMVTKSGTKDFHGTAFWNRRHEDMNANSFFNNRQGIARPIYRYFIGGFTFGGPIFIPRHFNSQKRKLFFFVSQEYTRVAQPTTTSTANLPTAAERSGDFSNSLNAAGRLIPIIDPTTGAQFSGNVIPKNRIDPTGQGILNLFLMPNGYVNPAPGQQYTTNFKASATPFFHRRDDIVRMDWAVTDHMLIYGRWGNDVNDQEYEFWVSPGVGPVKRSTPGYNWAGHIINTITSTTVNEVTIGVGHNNLIVELEKSDPAYFRTSSLNPPTLRPFPTGPGYLPYLPAATFAGGALPNPGAFYPGWTGNAPAGTLGTGFPFPYKNFNDTYTFQDDLSKVIGSHSLKTGVYYEYNSKIETTAGYNYSGQFNFGNNVNNPLDTGNGYANALLGIFQTYTEASNRLIPGTHFIEVEGYVQDNWRLNRRFTLDYGVRWYHVGIWKDDSNTYSNFYPQLWDPKQAARIYRPATAGGKTVAMDPLTGATTFGALQNTIVPGSGSAVNGMHVNGLTGNSDFYTFPFLVFNPRLGFAWDVFGDGKMAIRGSAGVFYSRPNANFVNGRGTAPTIYTPVVYYSPINQIPQAAASAAISPTNGTVYYGDQKIERNHQFNLTIQRDIGHGTVIDVAYVGNFDRHAQTTIETNPIPDHAYTNPANIFNNTEINPNLLRTRYPGMGSVLYYTDALSSVNYNGLQLGAQHRMSHGLQFGASFVFSKALGTCGAASNASGCTIGDPYHSYRNWYYGPMPWDRTKVFNLNWAYRIPGFSTNRLAKAVLNNWTISGITSFQTGAAATPDCSSVSAGPANSDPSFSGVGVWSASNPAGARCQQVADPNNFQKSFYTNFNTSAFTLAAPGTYGNTGLGILRQPAWYNIDTTIEKRIPVGKSERRVIRLRAEAYNLLNHTEFSTIGTSLQLSGITNLSTTYGQYTATLPARVLSSTIRFEF